MRLPQRIERNKADALYMTRIQGKPALSLAVLTAKVLRSRSGERQQRRKLPGVRPSARSDVASAHRYSRFKPYTGRRSSPVARLALPAPPSTPAPSSFRPSIPMSPSEIALQQVRARLAAKARPSSSRLR